MNRELVERSTYPAALEAIESELGEAWRAHGGDIAGVRIADDLTARYVLVRRDKSFLLDNRDILFGSVEEKIRTRLGDEGIRVALESTTDQPVRSRDNYCRDNHSGASAGRAGERRDYRARNHREWI